jgi:hypothetical protein
MTEEQGTVFKAYCRKPDVGSGFNPAVPKPEYMENIFGLITFWRAGFGINIINYQH